MTRALLLLLCAVPVVAQDAPRQPVVSARVSPEAPAIGEPITVELRVRAPLGSDVRFPALPDSVDAVEPLDPRSVRDASSGGIVDRTATYRLIAWDTGQRALRFGDITVRANGVDQRFRVALPPLRVRSVLPADSTGRVPKGARPPLEVGSWWWRFWIGVAVVAMLAAWAWRAWRRRRAEVAPEGADAADAAEEEFAQATALGLIEAGEPGRHALVHIGILRAYVAARFPQAPPSLTPREVATALRGAEFPVLPERVTDVLLRVEPVAFAAAPMSEAEAREVATEARAIVRDVETALRARRAAAPRPRRRSLRPRRIAREEA